MLGVVGRCPACKGTKLWRSRSAVYPVPFRALFVHPTRCAGCNLRFWGFGLAPAPWRPPSEKKPVTWAARRPDFKSSAAHKPVPPKPAPGAELPAGERRH